MTLSCALEKRWDWDGWGRGRKGQKDHHQQRLRMERRGVFKDRSQANWLQGLVRRDVWVEQGGARWWKTSEFLAGPICSVEWRERLA